MSRNSVLLMCAALSAVSACASDVASNVQALQPETASMSVRYLYRAYKTDPNLTLASYAVGWRGNCTGTMIGPNVFMTAAHCGFDSDIQLRFTFTADFGRPTSDNRTTTRSAEWPVFCKRLVQSFGDTGHSDMALYFCPNNAAGLGPGDVHGWIDFDQANVAVGQSVLGIFTTGTGAAATTTPLVAPNVPWATLQYGLGSILLNQRQACSSTDPSVAINGISGEHGNSGSIHLNTSNYRIAIGPLTHGALASSCGTPVADRWARAMWSYVKENRVFSGLTPPHISSSDVTALGLQPANYASASGTRLDANEDFVFDIHADIEGLRGENQRDWMYLGFDSVRRNRLWTTDSSVSFVPLPGNGFARVAKTTTSFRTLLRHANLHLIPGAQYRISLMTSTRAQGSANALSMGFCSMVNGLCQYSGNRWLPTQVGTTQTFTSTGTIAANATGASLDIDAHSSFDGDILAVSVVKINSLPGSSAGAAVMDFDTHDTRVNWRNDINGNRAVIVPDGRTTTAGSLLRFVSGPDITPLAPDWALYVERDPSSPAGFPARNGQLALTAGRAYSVCFSHRRTTSTPSTGMVRVQSFSGGSWVNSLGPMSFTPQAAWTEVCSPTFTVLGESSSMQFGFTGGYAADQNYLIDDMRIVAM